MSAMRFRNFGGIYQFTVANEEDLARIDALDPARWAATSAPVPDLHCDAAFLRYLDPEATGRIRVSQLIAARDWTFARLSRRDVLRAKADTLPLDALVTGDAGAKLRTAAERVNTEQKAVDPAKVTLADIRGYKSGYHKLLANGDGVIPPDVVTDPEVAAFIRDAMATVGSIPDRGGSGGIDQERLDRFITQGRAWCAWRARADAAAVWGDDTAGAWDLVQALDARIEAWFLYSDLLRQESPTPEALRLKDDDLRALRARDAATLEHYLADAPLAVAAMSGALPLDATINAVYRTPFAALRDKVLARALDKGTTSLTREAWRGIKATFGPYVTWLKDKPAEPFDALGEDRVRAVVEGDLATRAAAYITLDKAAQAEIDHVDDLEKLVLCIRWLVELANNIVNFSAIYRPDATALVEKGSLVIDARRLGFCLLVTDRTAHKTVAARSLCFLVYVKITEKEGGATVYEVVAPVTGGERGRLRVGKRGIFIDLDNKEFDAQIVEIVENPISVKEAALAPFRRAAAFIGQKVEEWVGGAADAQERALHDRAAASVTTAQTHVESTVASVTATATAPAPAPTAATVTLPVPPAPPREGINANSLILGGGVALAGVGAIIASLFSALTTLKGWVGILGFVAVVMGTSALAGWLKLRRRDMSLILEANGWAVNVHMMITRRIARVFAFVPDLPKGSVLDPTDVLPPVEGENRGRNIAMFLLWTFIAAGVVSVWVLYRAGLLPHLPRH